MAQTPGRPPCGDRPVLRRFMLDLSPLRDSPGYRRLWAGQAVSVVGTQLTRVALPYQACTSAWCRAARCSVTAGPVPWPRSAARWSPWSAGESPAC